MRQMHGEFRCQECSAVFESGNEFLRHYNTLHSDSKDFTRRGSIGTARNNTMLNLHSDYVTETLRRKNKELAKKVKKYKKIKSKMAKMAQEQQERLVALLEG